MMSERTTKVSTNGAVSLPLLSVLSISSYKLVFFSIWSTFILLSILPWQFTIVVAAFVGFVESKSKIKALSLSVISLMLSWGFLLLYWLLKSRGALVKLASDLSLILFGTNLGTAIILLIPLLVAAMLGVFGGLVGIYTREFLELRLKR